MSKKEVIKQIEKLTTILVTEGLVEKQHSPSEKNGKIYISGDFDHAISLKTNLDYKTIYKVLRKENNYNLLFLDGAILQLMYEFNSDEELLKSRLCYFPSPDLLSFDEGEEAYDTDDIYADIIGKNLFPTVIRFDYDPANHKEHHACSHVTFGQYKNCRVPVCSPLTPYRFVDFIIRNFYHNGYLKVEKELEKLRSNDFSNSIIDKETKIVHFNFN